MDDLLEQRQRQELAARAVETLEPLDRCILQLVLVEGLKPDAIAERLNMSPGAVRQRKSRATRRMVNFVQRLSQKPGPDHISSGRSARYV
jgi:RNA polymerase sigma factor (sigma-70 family)